MTRIEAAPDAALVLPIEYGAAFRWSPAGVDRVIGPDGERVDRERLPALDASDGISVYGCSYESDGNELTLTDCVCTPKVPVRPTALQSAVAAAFERAFRSRTMTVTRVGGRELSVALGDTVFTLFKIG